MIIICQACSGSGETSSGVPCNLCGGDGEIDLLDSAFHQIGIRQENLLKGQIWSILLDNTTQPVNVFDSYIILEELDTTEYNALTDEQKDGVSILLSCGKVDLNEGKAGRIWLTSWFGSESTTISNLTALL